MKTAALLPTPGDPLLARYWCRNYLATWAGEVDELIVLVNGDEGGWREYQQVGARVHLVKERMGHGQAMRQLLADTDADLVMFTEDDAFVRERGAVASTLRALADGDADVIGCPRGGMDPAIGVAATERWGPIVGPDGSSGHGLWPAFLFARARDLRATSQRFESWTWGTDEEIPGLRFTVPRPMTTDTMTTVAFELRDRFNISLTTNHKEMDQKVLPDGYVPWFHAGGLSNDPATARADMGDSNEGRDWAHRFWWWRRIGHDYSEHIARAAVDVDYWTPIIEPWITWDD